MLHPSFCVLRGTISACQLSSQWVWPSPLPSAPDDHRSGNPIRAVEIARLGFFPVFCRVEDLIVRGLSTETAGFLDGRGESYEWKCLVEGMGPIRDRSGHVS